MEEPKIILTVARYVVSHSQPLKGMLDKPHFFNFERASANKVHNSPYDIFRGFAVDILAEAIEKERFFGKYVSCNPNEACNSQNAEISPLRNPKKGLIIKATDFSETEEGLLIRIPLVQPKEYMEVLKSLEKFKKYSGEVDLLGSESGIRKAIDRLFLVE